MTPTVTPPTTAPPQMATWNIGDVVLKLMQARKPAMRKGQLAELAGVRPNTITNFLKGGSVDDATIEKVAGVFELNGTKLRQFRDELNAVSTNGARAARVTRFQRQTDRDLVLHEWEQNAKRIAKLPRGARTVMYSLLNAFEELCNHKIT